ncbi:MAG: arsenic efflux protein [Elusimicrobia bacterium]|nr:arsenic efflux protein [Elusimicrobiota bacterium]
MILPEFFIEAFWDTLKLLPLLVPIYFLVSLLEYRFGDRLGTWVVRSSWLAPLVGAFLGCLPQCGFSVIAATLYAKRLVSVGTLLAVFISTSDEAIPVLLSMPDQAATVGRLLLGKVVIAVVVGILVDLLGGRTRLQAASSAEKTTAVHGQHGCCAHDLCACRRPWPSLFWHPLRHIVTITLFLFVFNVILGGVIEGIGEEAFAGLFWGKSFFQPFLAVVIGLIPNCFASVLLADLYAKGAITFGALMAGLCAGAGLGLLVLFRENHDLRDSLRVLLILVVVSAAIGISLVMLS